MKMTYHFCSICKREIERGVICGKQSCKGQHQHNRQKAYWSNPLHRKMQSEKLRALKQGRAA
jgi:hypothetical protein